MVPDYVPTEISSWIQSMLALAPSDRTTISELCESPELRPAVPHFAEADDGIDGGACGACDEELGDGSKSRRRNRNGLSHLSALPPWLRRSLWMLIYASLCGVAIWSHLSAPEDSHVHVHSDSAGSTLGHGFQPEDD